MGVKSGSHDPPTVDRDSDDRVVDTCMAGTSPEGSPCISISGGHGHTFGFWGSKKPLITIVVTVGPRFEAQAKQL